MSDVICKRCGATGHVKNGIVRGFQRYHCRVKIHGKWRYLFTGRSTSMAFPWISC
jgi:transposase-like protein